MGLIEFPRPRQLRGLLVALLVWLPLTLSFAAEKQPVPSDTALKTAQASVNDLFKSELAAAKTAKMANQRTELADKLLEAFEGKPSSAAVDYVLLTEALNLTTSASNVSSSRGIVERLGELFVVDERELTLQAFKKLEKGPTDKDYHRELATTALQLAAEAQRAEQLDVAGQYLELVDSIGRRLKTNEWAKTTKARREEISEYKKLNEAFLAAEKTLKSNAHDAAANDASGRYLVAVKQDWNVGLQRLALSSNAALKKAAEQDNLLIDSPAAALSKDQAVAIADLWWDVASQQTGPAMKAAILLRAGQWYSMANAELTGLVKTKAEKRIAESGWDNDPELKKLMPLNRREHSITLLIAKGRGMLENDFAIVQTLPIAEAKQLDEDLKVKKLRAIRFRPYPTPDGIKVAAIWRRSSVKGDLFEGTTEEVIKRDQELRLLGYIPNDIAGYVDADGNARHVLISRIGKLGEGETHNLSVHWRIANDNPFNQPTPSAMWTRQQYLGKDGTRYNDIIWRHPKKTYYYFHGDQKFYEKKLAEHAESQKLMDVCVCAADKKPGYSAALQGLSGFTVTEIHGLSLEQNLVEWRKVMQKGALPVAIGVAITTDGKTHSASVWHTSDKK